MHRFVANTLCPQCFAGPLFFGFSDVHVQRAIAAQYTPAELAYAQYGTLLPAAEPQHARPVAVRAADAAAAAAAEAAVVVACGEAATRDGLAAATGQQAPENAAAAAQADAAAAAAASAVAADSVDAAAHGGESDMAIIANHHAPFTVASTRKLLRCCRQSVQSLLVMNPNTIW
jgi:hypothetical protein